MVEIEQPGLRPGQTVRLSISGPAFARALAGLFGPALIWTVVVAALAASGVDWMAPMAIAGYLAVLMLGSALAGRLTGALDLRASAEKAATGTSIPLRETK